MTLDESVYTDPVSFNPARFLPKPEGNGEPYPSGPWGFGRRSVLYLAHIQSLLLMLGHRICPGRHLAHASLWIAMASTLATMKVTKKLDANGKEITPDIAFTSGITRCFVLHFLMRTDDSTILLKVTHARISAPFNREPTLRGSSLFRAILRIYLSYRYCRSQRKYVFTFLSICLTLDPKVE